MALITAFLGFLGRFTGRFLTTTLGWASVLLFGRIPEERQLRFTILTLGSLVWVILLVGVLLPDVGTVLLAFVPLPPWKDRGIVRLAMLVAAVILPVLLGGVALSVADPADRPKGAAVIVGVMRGYLITPILAVTLAILAVAGIVRKAKAALKKRATGHVPIVVRPGQYEALVEQLERTLRATRLVTGRRGGSRALTGPARLLAGVSGTGFRKLVPDRLAVLEGPELELEIYPSDLAISGSTLVLARARAAILRELDSTHCWFTTERRAQEIEDMLAKVDESPASWDPAAIREVDRRLGDEAIAGDEWDVLYRRRLQVAAEATGTNLGDRGARGTPGGSQSESASVGQLSLPIRPTPGTLVGLVTAGLVIADIVLLSTGRRRSRRSRRSR